MTSVPLHRVRRLVTAAAVAACALAGCTFGDEPKQAGQAETGLDGWMDVHNCVPVECMFVCCQGWEYIPEPRLRGGNVPGSACEKVRTLIPAYGDYVTLMRGEDNLCPEDFKYWESGYCHVIEPADAIEGYRPDGQPVYSGLSFAVCPPKGQPVAHPLEDVELIPQE
jgi:hypothetical protein